MKLLIAILVLCPLVAAQTPGQPGIQYSAYTVLLVSHEKGGDGEMMGIDKQGRIVFVPIPSITKAVNEEGVSPVRYGDLLQLLRQVSEENQRLKAENDHLWKVAENHGSSTPVVIQQAVAQPQDNSEAARQQMRMMLLRNLLAPRSSTMNVNVTDCTRYPALCVGR